MKKTQKVMRFDLRMTAKTKDDLEQVAREKGLKRAEVVRRLITALIEKRVSI